MNAPNMSSILDRQSSEIERPKPLPVGSYICTVKGLPEFGQSSKKKTDQVVFTLVPTGTLDDVDDEDLQAALLRKDGKNRLLGDLTISATYYITEDAVWRLKKFLDDCEIEEGDKSLRERCEEANGCQVIAVLKHESSEDGQAVFARLNSTAKYEG